MKKRVKMTQTESMQQLMTTSASLGDIKDASGSVSEIVRGIYVSTTKHPEKRLVGVCGSAYEVYQYQDIVSCADNAFTFADLTPTDTAGYSFDDGKSMMLRYTFDNPQVNIKDAKVGDEFSVGIEFSTGHQGWCRPQAIIGRGFITRLACLNGMRSKDRAFRFSIKHFDTQKVDEKLVGNINASIRNLQQMVEWFGNLHSIECSEQQGMTILENIPMAKRIRSKSVELWGNPQSIIGVQTKTYNGRHLGNLVNAVTQVLTHEQENINVLHSNTVGERVFDTIVAASKSREAFNELATPKKKEGESWMKHEVMV